MVRESTHQTDLALCRQEATHIPTLSLSPLRLSHKIPLQVEAARRDLTAQQRLLTCTQASPVDISPREEAMASTALEARAAELEKRLEATQESLREAQYSLAEAATRHDSP